MRVIPWLLTVVGTIWATGNLALLIVATALFSWAPPKGDLLSRAAAGAAFGTVLERWSAVTTLLMLITMCAVGWCGIIAWRREWRGRAIALAAAVTLTVIIHTTCQQTIVTVNHMGVGIRELRAKPDTDPKVLASLEERFAKFHSASEVWFSLETLIGLSLLLGGSIALFRQTQTSAQAPAPASTPSKAKA